MNSTDEQLVRDFLDKIDEFIRIVMKDELNEAIEYRMDVERKKDEIIKWLKELPK